MYKYIVMVAILMVMGACQSGAPEPQHLSGEALGTDYSIIYFSETPFNAEKGIVAVFDSVNKSMSNYIPTSDISRRNAGDTSVQVDYLFREVFLRSKDIYQKTRGYFDPTVGNLVNAYGFGAQPERKIVLDSLKIDSLMQSVGLQEVQMTDDHRIVYKHPNTYLDFNGIAKGYAVDRVGLFLESRGAQNYMVNIGGEIRVRGRNLNSDRSWRFGIDDPRIETHGNQLSGIVELEDQAMATSGNYRKFALDSVSGQKYVHIMDPKSGYIKKQNILSASVIAEDCTTADAYATALMAMGVERAVALSKELEEIEVFLIYDDQGALKTYASSGFENRLVKK